MSSYKAALFLLPEKFALKYDVRGKRNQYNKVSKEIGEINNIITSRNLNE